MRDPEACFDRWAPSASPWSAWTKPVVFATADRLAPGSPLPAWGGWTPAAAQPDTALVLDLPGDDGVAAALVMAQAGYQPVVLYNGCPGPAAVVDVACLAEALAAGAPALPPPREGAPPAFLLDARRDGGRAEPRPETYDNRWAVFAQDLPSGARLSAAGIRRIVVVAAVLSDDLLHVLRRWQEAGLVVSRAEPSGMEAVVVDVPRPSRFRSLLHRWQVLVGLRRNGTGAFGELVPRPSSGG